nr:MAG TPA_asm: hypothetical protein [Caudoviricetes sp.]
MASRNGASSSQGSGGCCYDTEPTCPGRAGNQCRHFGHGACWAHALGRGDGMYIMTHERDQLIAYVATLVTLIICFLGALVAGVLNDAVISKMEAFGMGTLVGGLIGVLRIPSARSVTVDNPPSQPMPTEDADR